MNYTEHICQKYTRNELAHVCKKLGLKLTKQKGGNKSKRELAKMVSRRLQKGGNLIKIDNNDIETLKNISDDENDDQLNCFYHYLTSSNTNWHTCDETKTKSLLNQLVAIKEKYNLLPKQLLLLVGYTDQEAGFSSCDMDILKGLINVYNPLDIYTILKKRISDDYECRDIFWNYITSKHLRACKVSEKYQWLLVGHGSIKEDFFVCPNNICLKFIAGYGKPSILFIPKDVNHTTSHEYTTTLGRAKSQENILFDNDGQIEEKNHGLRTMNANYRTYTGGMLVPNMTINFDMVFSNATSDRWWYAGLIPFNIINEQILDLLNKKSSLYKDNSTTYSWDDDEYKADMYLFNDDNLFPMLKNENIRDRVMGYLEKKLKNIGEKKDIKLSFISDDNDKTEIIRNWEIQSNKIKDKIKNKTVDIIIDRPNVVRTSLVEIIRDLPNTNIHKSIIVDACRNCTENVCAINKTVQELMSDKVGDVYEIYDDESDSDSDSDDENDQLQRVCSLSLTAISEKKK